MSESEAVDLGSRGLRVMPERFRKETSDSLPPPFERPATGEREGLPPNYRMRADAHYVEQLTSRSPDLTVRFIPIDDIDGGAEIDSRAIEPLTQSIAAVGVLQPVLLRRDEDRYRLIDGRKRLAAARAAGLLTVPSLIHQADDSTAELLAVAGNLRVGMEREKTEADFNLAQSPLLAKLGEELGAIESAATLLTSQTLPTVRRVSIDMIRAGAWRASWLLSAAGMLERDQPGETGLCLLGSLLDRVRDGFLPESRLSGVEVQVCIPDWNVSAAVDEPGLIAGLSGALVATFGILEQTAGSVVTLIASASPGGVLSIDVAQDAVVVPADMPTRFFDSEWSDRPGGWAATVGALVARTAARQHGGDALFMVRDRRGSTLRINLNPAR